MLGGRGSPQSHFLGPLPAQADLGTIGPATLNFIKGGLAPRQHRVEEARTLLSRSDQQDEDQLTTFLLGESDETANPWADAAQEFQRILGVRDSSTVAKIAF